MSTARIGTLFVVATPIGNLGDLSARAGEVLAQADLVVAEDTRRTGQLLQHLGLHKAMSSCHKFSEARVMDALVARLLAGDDLALVTDGGTPALSDPGYRLVSAALDAGARSTPVPGPCAAVAALSATGFPADRFHFAGFLPSRSSARRKEIATLARQECSLVLYEAPHRLLACLEDLERGLGDRSAAICRELTKLHEEILRGKLSELRADISGRDRIRGEIVLVLAGADDQDDSGQARRDELEDLYEQALEAEDGDPKRAVRRVARDQQLPRAELRRILGL